MSAFSDIGLNLTLLVYRINQITGVVMDDMARIEFE